MIALIDTIFFPLLSWLNSIQGFISDLSVPVSRPLNVSNYLGPFALLGPFWLLFITNALLLGFIYMIAYLLMITNGVTIKFKNLIKWW